MARDYVIDDGEGRELTVDEVGARLRVSDGETTREIAFAADQRGPIREATVDGRRVEVGVRRAAGVWQLTIGGVQYVVPVDDARFARLRRIARSRDGGAGGRRLQAPIPGMVVRLLVAAGDEVVRGQPVLILDAMKLENELAAPGAGVVARIHVEPGQPVEKGDLLLELE